MTEVVLRGLAHPFYREATDFARAESVALIKQNIATVLTTPKGTLPWRPEFGSELHRLRHSNVSNPAAVAQAYVGRALERWVPYVRVQRVSAARTGGTLSILVAYQIVSGVAARNETVEQAITLQP